MDIHEAVKWLDPDCRDKTMKEFENASGVEIVDIVINKFNEACRTVINALKEKDLI